MYAIGIDIGYGYTKGLTSTGRPTCALADRQEFFVSAVGPAEEIDYRPFESARDRLEAGKSIRGDGGKISLNGNDYFFGALALCQSRCLLQARDRSWIDSEPYQVLLSAVLDRMLPQGYNGLVSVVIGLPISYYADREKLAEVVTRLAQLRAPRVITKVIPRPFGTFFDYILDQQGELLNAQEALKRTGIIDIGYYTTDFAEVNRLEYIAKGSNTIELGVSTVLDQIARKAYRHHRRRLDREEAEEALKLRCITVRGKAEDAGEVIDKAVEDATGALQAEELRLWQEGIDLERILVTGGGGNLFHKVISRIFPSATAVASSQWANVRGYLRYA